MHLLELNRTLSSVIPSPVPLCKYLLIFLSGRKGERVNVINSPGAWKVKQHLEHSMLSPSTSQLIGVLAAALYPMIWGILGMFGRLQSFSVGTCKCCPCRSVGTRGRASHQCRTTGDKRGKRRIEVGSNRASFYSVLASCGDCTRPSSQGWLWGSV